ncbi:MAG: cytochrome c oxidase subunit 4, partial [Actinomycetota bacterium]|nr:cytochrome c oxidase subunit 4 [Actinomycetota bacterium]
MKAEIKLFGLLAPFFLLLTVVYAYFTGMAEWVGIVGLALTTAFSAFIAGYLALTARKLDLRP